MSTGTPASEKIKDKAKLIRQFMKEKCAAEISVGHSLELASQVLGFKDWNTASAVSKSKAKQLDLPVQLSTVGELKKLLAHFDDSDTIDADYEFDLAEFLSEIDDIEQPDKVFQEFSLSFEGFNSDILTFKLKLEHEDSIWEDSGEILPDCGFHSQGN